MIDEVLNLYIQTLLTEKIEEEKFERYIDIFSKFLGYTNRDYKYNGTYLGKYVVEFEQVYHALKKKNEIYDAVYLRLFLLEKSFELTIDGSYNVKCSSIDHIQREYIDFNKERILSTTIEVCIKFIHAEDEHTFCKEYKDLGEQLLDSVAEDVIQFRNRIRRTSNGSLSLYIE